MKSYVAPTLIAFFLGLSVLMSGVYAFTPTPTISNNWHPGFVEVDVEVIDPPSTWFPPTSVPDSSLQTVLVNVEHIVTIGIFRGHTSKTPRYAMLLTNDSMLVVHHDYDDLLKLIRAAWVGSGKK